MTAYIRAIDPKLPTAIKFVRQYRAQKVVYDIEMYSNQDSQDIRDAYGLFFRKKSGKRMPDSLKGISISNVTTFSTRVRVRLLKEVSHRHQLANPTVSCFVTAYLPRPELKIRECKGPLTSLSYTKTVQQLSHHLSYDFLRELTLFARTNLPEKELKERFLVLSPDLLIPSQQDNLSMSVDEASPQNSSTPFGAVLTQPPVSQAPVQLPPTQAPGPSSQSVALSTPPLPQPPTQSTHAAEGTDDDFIVVRNKGRFSKRSREKSSPYPKIT